jgi:tetratricopeptide (TPR) repeat protein
VTGRVVPFPVHRGHVAPCCLVLCLWALAALAAGALPVARAGDAATAEAALRLRIGDGPKSRDPATVLAWAAGLAEEGRARRGTLLGGDCLAAAAAALSGSADTAQQALALWKQCAAAYPEGAPETGLAWHERGVLEARITSGAEGATIALASLEASARLAAMPPPLDADADLRRRHAHLRTTAEGLGRSWRAELLGRLGRHAEAADLHEALARARGDGSGRGASGADVYWERAAVAAWRAGDRPRALEAIARAIEATTDEERLGELSHWRLLAAHGRLDERGEPTVRTEPPVTDGASLPDDAFLPDALAALDRLRGLGRVTFALRLASHLLVAGRAADAVAFYAAAFTDPAFAAGPSVAEIDRRRLLTGALAAFDAGQFETAREWALRAERGAGGSLPGVSDLLLRIDAAIEARDLSLADAEPATESSAAREGAAGDGRARRGREGLLVPRDPDAPEPAADEPVAVDVAAPHSPLLFGLLAAGLALVAVLVWRARRPVAPHAKRLPPG